MAKIFKIPFAMNGDKTEVPDTLQPDGSASYPSGFGPDYELDKEVDPVNAKDVPRDQTNQLFNDVTSAIGEIQQLGIVPWYEAMAPYPINAYVRHNDTVWRSASALNSSEPGDDETWVDATVSFVDTVNAALATIAASGNINLTSGAPQTSQVSITGSGATISGFTVAANRFFVVRFSGANTIVNSGSINTRRGENIVTVAGDSCLMYSTADNTVEILCYSTVKRKVRGAAVTTNSGSSHDVTGIPSWANKITIKFESVSTNGTSLPQIQLGAGSIDSAGYLGSAADGLTAGTTAANHNTGFLLGSLGNAAYTRHGSVTLTRLSGNVWVLSGTLGLSDMARGQMIGGSKSLSGALDRFRLTTVNGTDLFDGGQFSYEYED